MFIHLVYQRDLIMKINSSPVLKNPKLTLNKDIQNRKSGYIKSTRSDEFVSSTKNVRKSNDFITLAEGIKNYFKYGFSSAEDFKILSKFCTVNGLICEPALDLVLNMYKDLGGGDFIDAKDCESSSQFDFINYMDSVKTNGKFDNIKLELAKKIEKPFEFLKLQSHIDELKYNRKDYPILIKALDNGADIYFLMDSMHILNKAKKPYSKILDMVKLSNKLKEQNPASDFIDSIAINCYENPVPIINFYTPDVVSIIDNTEKPQFYPETTELANTMKNELLTQYKEIGNKHTVKYVNIITDKDSKVHFLQIMTSGENDSSMHILNRGYNNEGKLVSVENSDISSNKKGKTYFQDMVTHTEVCREYEIINPYWHLIKEQKITRKTPDGKILRTEYYKLSKLPGVYDVFYSYPDGHIEVISRGAEDPLTGEKIKKAHLTSTANVASNVQYNEQPNGSANYVYKITGANGNTLLERQVSKKVIDDNHIISTIDGREYSIKHESNKLVISSLVGGKPVGKKYYMNIVNGNSTKKRPAVIADPHNSVISSLKDVPAEFIIKLIDKKIIIDKTKNKPSAFLPSENKIEINSTSPASNFVILHEGVHSLDIDFIHNTIQYNLSKNTDFKKAIEKELRQAQATEPALIFNHEMNYYFKLNAANRRIGEIFADATALTYNLPDINSIALRVFELMRNFPTSIAKSLSNFNRVR